MRGAVIGRHTITRTATGRRRRTRRHLRERDEDVVEAWPGYNQKLGTATAVSAPSPVVRGPGSRSQATTIAEALARGVEQAATGLGQPVQTGGSRHIDRLKLRLPATASKTEMADALARALAAELRRRDGA